MNDIAKRFGTDTKTLLKNNPSLMGSDKIYPGQIIAVKYDAQSFGNAVVNGYYYEKCPSERLSLFLPYLTYLTISAAKFKDGRLEKIFTAKAQKDKALLWKVIPILRIYTENGAHELKNAKNAFFESAINMAKEEGFSGISLAAYRACEDEKLFSNFLMDFKRELILSELELHLELDGNKDITSYELFSDIADVSVLNYDKCAVTPIPDFECGEERVLKNFANGCECQKTLIDLSEFAYINGEPYEFSDIEKILRGRGIAPEFCEKTKTSSFKANRFSKGVREEIHVSYPTPENTKAKLELLGELGFMGVSFDIMRSSVSSLMTFNSLFHCESLRSAENNSCRGSD